MDTTVLVDFFDGDAGARAIIEPILDGDTSAAYSPITTFEIWFGLSSPEEQVRFSAILNALEFAPLSDAAARVAATWLKGTSPRRAEALFRDALIAATARERGETIITGNVRDFARFNVAVRPY